VRVIVHTERVRERLDLRCMRLDVIRACRDRKRKSLRLSSILFRL
jgi:hypothetical protein